MLQLSSNKSVFEKGKELLLDKWIDSKDVYDELTNFFLNWPDGWYEGYAQGKPSHNNALE
jgi:hypothetical protein